jgi:hypothetical protein
LDVAREVIEASVFIRGSVFITFNPCDLAASRAPVFDISLNA